jgi:hypothetical protein
MRSIWLLNDATTDPLMGERQSKLVRDYLRANGFITRLESDLANLAERVIDGDVVLGVGWDERLLKIKGLVENAALERVAKRKKIPVGDVQLGDIEVQSVKLVALLPWGQKQAEGVATEQREFEESLLRELDIALVRSSTEKAQLLGQHQIFHEDDVQVVGGFETIFNVLNACPKVSWEARENRIVFPYQELKSTGYDVLIELVAEYTSRYPSDNLKLIPLFGRVSSRDLYLAEVAKAKVMFSGRVVGWPTELIDASFLGVYPLTPDEGIFKEVMPEGHRYTNRGNRVDHLHDLIHQDDGCPMLNFAAMSMAELMKAL